MLNRLFPRALRMLILIGLLLTLQGCLSLATSGASAIYSRHSWENNINDQFLFVRANQAIYFRTDDFEGTNINISVSKQRALLTGEVNHAWQRERAAEIVANVPGIKKVYNHLEVTPLRSALIQAQDAWLTTKIKSKLIFANDVDGSKVKVVTENGKVYLMGELTQEEADAAKQIALNTNGVREVVPVFTYLLIVNT